MWAILKCVACGDRDYAWCLASFSIFLCVHQQPTFMQSTFLRQRLRLFNAVRAVLAVVYQRRVRVLRISMCVISETRIQPHLRRI